MAIQEHPTLTIAGVGVSLVCSDGDLTRKLNQRYWAFIDPGRAEFSVVIDYRPRTSGQISPYLKVIGGSGIIEVIPGFEQRQAADLDYSGTIDLLHHRARLSFAASTPLEEIEYFLRVVYILLIFRTGGVMLHAAGILRDGRVYVFFGHSGAGKSTVARLSPPEMVLNDDLICLIPAGEGWMIHATPFWSPSQTQPNPVSGPLAGVYRLAQDNRVYTQLMSPGEAVAELLASIPVIPDIPDQRPELLRRCMDIQKKIEIKTMHFLPDASFWKEIVP